MKNSGQRNLAFVDNNQAFSDYISESSTLGNIFYLSGGIGRNGPGNHPEIGWHVLDSHCMHFFRISRRQGHSSILHKSESSWIKSVPQLATNHM